ncbi:hypothetical protein B0H11DRAFT_1915551 [Mycena galericulata]|nr:hypothetical protein B0H11DRAFT_1915551 [Mycena galericulata]
MDRQAPDASESVSAVGTQYYSAPAGPGPSDARGSSPDDVATVVSADRVQRLTIHLDEQGVPYLVDGDGNHVATSDSISTQRFPRGRSTTTEDGDEIGPVPIHHSVLFPERQSVELSSESGISDSVPTGVHREGLSARGSPDNLPIIDLGIDPTETNSRDVERLNAIRGHLGAANARLLATTAIVAEQQATTEELQESIHSTRVDVLSRLDSLRNEVTSQRSRISRCLDDNLRVLKETGASSSQISNLLDVIREHSGSPRQDRPIPPHMSTPASTSSVIVPESVQTAADAIISPRAASESPASFDKRAEATMRTKNQTLAAFPLPAMETTVEPVQPTPSAPAPALIPKFTMLNNAKATGRFEMPLDHRQLATDSGNARVERMLNVPQPSVRRVQMTSASNARGVPAGMNNSMSGYHSGAHAEDVVEEFTSEMEEVIRQTIDRRVGTKLELPPGVRPPKVDNPTRFRGQDSHDYFMTFLEKLLGWMRAGCFCGPELDDYRIVLLQGVLDDDAHRWFVTEVDNPRLAGHFDLDFTDVVCALYRRYVKSATAQRATREFDAVEWNPTKGPEDLYSSLINRGQSMIEMPSQFVLKTRFIKALPTWISKEMRLRRGLTIEFSTLESIRSHARQIWETDQGIKDEEAAERPHASSSSRPDNGNPRFQQERRVPRVTETNLRNDTRNDRSSRPPTRDSRPHTGQPSQEKPGKKVCFSCGGDHYARDKICPNYSEQRPGRDARVAAQRVRESYSDEESEESEEYGYEAAIALSDDDDLHDPNSAPDLDTLIADSREEEVHLHAMREQPVRLQYYSMRIEDDDEAGDSPALFGNYNPGPVCVVCHECELVRRQVAATSENGLVTDQEYTVCAHLALAGLDPASMGLPSSPAASSAPLLDEDTSEDEVPKNWLGDPDLPPGVLIDLEEPTFARSALDDVRDHDAARVRAGHPALTPLEFYINLNWVRHYRYYPDESDEERQVLQYLEDSHQEMRGDPEFGPETRARDALTAEESARSDEQRITTRGAGSNYELEPALAAIAEDIGERATIYLLDMRISDRMQQVVVTRQWIRMTSRRRNIIDHELDTPSIPQHVEELWEAARMANIEGDARMSYELVQLESELRRLRAERSAEQDDLNDRLRASVMDTMESLSSLSLDPPREAISRSPAELPRLPRSILVPGHEELGSMPMDEAAFWSAQTPFSADEMDRSLIPEVVPSIATATDGEHPAGSGTRTENWYTPEVLAMMNEQTPEHIADAAEYDAQAGLGLTWDEELERRDRVREANQPRGWLSPHEVLGHDWFNPHEEFFAIRACENEGNPELMPDVPDIVLSSDDAAVITVQESYDSTIDQPIDPHTDDEEILQSVIMTGPRDAELVVVKSDHNGNIYTQTRSLPAVHYLSPGFRAAHEQAMKTAIRERHADDESPPLDEEQLTQWSNPEGEVNGRDRRGFPDTHPRLLPGVAFHERLASLDPEFDDESALPGFRVQFLAGRTSAETITRRVNNSNQPPAPIGLLDQPSRTRDSTAHGIILDFGKRELRFPNGHVIPALPITAEVALISRRSAARRETAAPSTEEGAPQSDRATQGSLNTPIKLPRRRPSVTIEELPEEDTALPSLPDGYARYMEKEDDFQAGINPAVPNIPATAAPTPSVMEETTQEVDDVESDSEDEGAYFDCDDGHAEQLELDETFCIECWNETERESVLHLTLDHVNETARTPQRKTSHEDITPFGIRPGRRERRGSRGSHQLHAYET